jgi:hypothetical protein
MIPQENQRQAVLAAYIAGIIDGEGCIRIGLQSRDGLPYNYRPSVSIGMVEPQVVNLCKELFGGNVYCEKRVQDLRQIYRWNLVKAPDVKRFLDTISPYLMIKTEQALNVLELVNNYPQSRRMSQEELQRRKELYLISRKLNVTGAAATTNRDDIREDEVIV